MVYTVLRVGKADVKKEGSGSKRMKGGQGARQGNRRSNSSVGVRWSSG